jgi:UTP--glucose-1-phosphate uridylyltransferase
MIRDYFHNDKFYISIIKKKKDPRIIKEYKKILRYKKMIKFVYQNNPLGTGDAVLKTKKYIKDKFFLMLLPDDLIIKNNCSKSMIKIHKKYNSSVMASMKVQRNNVSRWGIYKLNKKLDKRNFLIDDVVEKPSTNNAPSNKAVIGRYILPKKIFSKLLKQKPGKGGEVHITDSIQKLIRENNKFIAHNFSGKYLDCGSMNGYIKSSLEISKL